MSLSSTLVSETQNWGLTKHQEAWRRQEELVTKRIAGRVGDTLVLTEHEPVFTVGLHLGAENHVVWDAAQRAQAGVDLVKTNRGGDITYHGPGQIVGYPIVSLAARQDLHAYLRFLEQVLINTVGCLGLAAGRRPGKTGIWLGERKVAAIGVAARRWVTYHGFALNVDPDLAHFGGIVPCGIASTDGTVTSIAAELGRPVAMEEVRKIVTAEFWSEWDKFLSAAPAPDSP